MLITYYLYSWLDNYEINNIMRFAELKETIELSPVFSNNNILDTFLEDNCPVAYNSPFKIYRGVNYDSKGYLLKGDSRTEERKSANTLNYYTLLLDNVLPEWKEYPKRSRSFICTTELTKTYLYGNTYQVYPIGDPLIGICPEADLWISFDCFNPRDFGYLVVDLFKYLKLKPVDDLNGLLYLINLIDINWKLGSDEITHIIGRYINLSYDEIVKFDSFIDLFRYIFNPTENDFQYKKLSELLPLRHDREIWFSGPAYFVPIGKNNIY